MTTLTEAREPGSAAATLQMIRAEINVREFHRWMGVRRLQDPDHAMHCLLTECFGKPPTQEYPEGEGLAPRAFRLIIPRDGAVGTLYGYGPADAEKLREAAQLYGDPAQCQILNLPTLATKSMPTQWPAGKRLGFELRIRPVVRSRQEPWGDVAKSGRRKGEECDVFQWEALRYPKGEMNRSREQVYRDWLAGLLERDGGATLEREDTRLASFRRTRAIRKLRQRHCEGPDAVMQGNLTIADPAEFAQMLARGIGRHRAYGYGMLLLRQPRR